MRLRMKIGAVAAAAEYCWQFTRERHTGGQDDQPERQHKPAETVDEATIRQAYAVYPVGFKGYFGLLVRCNYLCALILTIF